MTNVKKTEIASTRILCMDNPKHDRHLVVLYNDGSLKCECGPDGEADGMRMGTAVALGASNVLRSSCASLIAFVAVGLPQLVAARVDATGKWGGWKRAWDRYSANALVREAFRDLAQKRDERFGETFKVAHRAIVSCGRYRDGMSRSDFGEEVSFLPESHIEVGATIALFSSDSWAVPLQPDWLESVGKAKPVIDGRFIVGVGAPGFVYAIDGSNAQGYSICEFAVIGDRLGKLAKAKAA